MTYIAQDANGTNDVAMLTINLQPVNDPPVAVDDMVDIRQAGAFSIPFADLIANDSAGPADEIGQTLRIASVPNESSEGAMLEIVGTNVIVTPDDEFVGKFDSFEYNLSDGSDELSPATVVLNFIQNLSGSDLL